MHAIIFRIDPGPESKPILIREHAGMWWDLQKYLSAKVSEHGTVKEMSQYKHQLSHRNQAPANAYLCTDGTWFVSIQTTLDFYIRATGVKMFNSQAAGSCKDASSRKGSGVENGS